MAAIAAESDLTYLSAAALGHAYAARELSPVEVADAYLRRIQQVNPQLHCYITVTADLALARAREAEQRYASGSPRGPLDGVPVALKDLVDTAGVRTTAHSALFADRVPTEDATVARRLGDAGAVLLGKLSMFEFASGGVNTDGPFPPARNPWNVDFSTGGSSSGSGAAVAAGLCAAALGSDTGGSIRSPSSYCGIVGLKPTYGLVSRRGVIPLAWTLDHVGPMTRTVEDAAIVLECLAGHDPADPASVRAEKQDYRSALDRGLEGLRVGTPTEYLEAFGLDPETAAAYRDALEMLARLGASVIQVETPEIEHVATVGNVLLSAEAFAYHQQNARARPHLYGRRFYGRLLEGALISAADYLQAQRGRSLICQAMGELMRTVNLLVLPTTARPAARFADDAGSPLWRLANLTRWFNVTGQPAISVPCGFTDAGLPIGLQIAGRPFEDGVVLAAAHAYERANDWADRRPRVGQSAPLQ